MHFCGNKIFDAMSFKLNVLIFLLENRQTRDLRNKTVRVSICSSFENIDNQRHLFCRMFWNRLIIVKR